MFYLVSFSLFLVQFICYFFVICSFCICTSCIRAISRDSHWYKRKKHTGLDGVWDGFFRVFRWVFFILSLSLFLSSEDILSSWLFRLFSSLSSLILGIISTYRFLFILLYINNSLVKPQFETIHSICTVHRILI